MFVIKLILFFSYFYSLLVTGVGFVLIVIYIEFIYLERMRLSGVRTGAKENF